MFVFNVCISCGVYLFDHLAAVSCSLNTPRLGGVKIGFWLTGNVGCPYYPFIGNNKKPNGNLLILRFFI